MSGKLLYVRHQLCLLRLRGGTTHSATKSDGLTGYFTLEGTEDELGSFWGGKGVVDVEPGPVDLIAWGREGVVGVPQEGGGVGEVADLGSL
jgi:hypothetical protein